MKRLARTRSEKRASQPVSGRAQWSVGSIEEDGILYGLTTYALIRRTIAIAPAIVTTQSTIVRHGCGSRRASLSTGLCVWCSWGTSTGDDQPAAPPAAPGPANGLAAGGRSRWAGASSGRGKNHAA